MTQPPLKKLRKDEVRAEKEAKRRQREAERQRVAAEKAEAKARREAERASKRAMKPGECMKVRTSPQTDHIIFHFYKTLPFFSLAIPSFHILPSCLLFFLSVSNSFFR